METIFHGFTRFPWGLSIIAIIVAYLQYSNNCHIIAIMIFLDLKNYFSGWCTLAFTDANVVSNVAMYVLELLFHKFLNYCTTDWALQLAFLFIFVLYQLCSPFQSSLCSVYAQVPCLLWYLACLLYVTQYLHLLCTVRLIVCIIIIPTIILVYNIEQLQWYVTIWVTDKAFISWQCVCHISYAGSSALLDDVVRKPLSFIY